MVELISVHIPKTAGTAFQKTLLHVYGSEQVLLDYPPDRVYRPGEPIADSIKVIHGHFALKKYRNHFPEAYRIVWLRHPVFRLISEYFYALTIHDTKNVAHAELFEKNLDIVGFAKLPSMQNHMQRWLQEIELEDLYFVGLQEFYPQDIDDLKSL
ncbi:MAG: sulfotransferase family 2 domain-containing protein [Microcoleaceae cyanobacterium]